ncbi:MAG: DUF4352 domain-containing protein [Thermoproteota archaeon]
MLNDRRGVSPVITTVIIVAVGITIAIAVALWMTGLVGAFMGYEKIEVRSAYASPVEDEENGNAGWTVSITVTNTGSSPTKIDNIFVNNVPIDQWSGPITLEDNELPITVKVGDEVTFTLLIPEDCTAPGMTLKSGVTATIKLHSTGGKEYFTSVVLP